MTQIANVQVGWAGQADIPGVIDVLIEIADFRASLGQDRWRKSTFTYEAVGEWIARRELVVARIDGRVVGTMLIQPADEVFWPDRPDGEAFYVHKLTRTRKAPEAKGLVAPLITFAEQVTRDAGRPLLRLDCAIDEKLCALYENLGFQRGDVVEPSPGLVSVRWEKCV